MAYDASDLFRRWFCASIAKLKELPEGDGAIAAMMIALPLYERAIAAREKLSGRGTTEDDLKNAMAQDLGLTGNQRRVFWAVYRVGLMHQAMPHTGHTKWLISAKFEATPKFIKDAETTYVCVDPWKFSERVLAMYKNDPRLITASESFPFASIFSFKSPGETKP